MFDVLLLKYTVGLTGMSTNGMGYDYDISNSESFFTHANAFSLHSNFELVGGCDPDINKRKRFEKRYSQTFSSVSQLIQAENPEIFVVSSPTKTHDQVIKEIIEIGQPKLILCEKPLTSSYKKSKLINNLCKASKVPIILNFPRRAEIGIKKIKQMILSEKLIPPFKVNVFYSKGLMHNGIHFVDLLSYFFGEIKASRVIKSGHNEKNIDISLEYDISSANLISWNEEFYENYSMELLSPSGKIIYGNDSSIEFKSVNKDKSRLNLKGIHIENNSQIYQLNVVEEILLFMKNSKTKLTTGDEFLSYQRVIDNLLKHN